MPTRPLPKREHDRDPPAVELLRERLRDSRIGAFVRRHKAVAAVVASVLVVLKALRWLALDVWRFGSHAHWIASHWTLVAVAAVILFLIAFAVSRLGIDWLDADEDAEVDPRSADEQLQRARDAATMRR